MIDTVRKYYHSSKSGEYVTPQWLFDALNQEFGFTVDAAATESNRKCDKYFTQLDDGLLKSWVDEIVWCNPPYGRKEIGRWLEKGYYSSKAGATCVFLVPARLDSGWWHDWCMKGEIRIFRRRLRFDNANNWAPFASAVIVFRPYQHALISKPEYAPPSGYVSKVPRQPQARW
jgi:phage N-6-adenine-methyltransferase